MPKPSACRPPTLPGKVLPWAGARIVTALVALAVVALPASVAWTDGRPVTLFAPASTTEALTAVARAYTAAGRGQVRLVFAASSTLAQQIDRGAPADLFLSANRAWADHLAKRGRLLGASRIDLLGNTLVLVAPLGSELHLGIAPGFPLAEALGERRLAMGDPGHVPVGIYARAALESLGVWPAVRDKAAFAGDVRAALALVERGEAVAGIVYGSDAASGARVRVVAAFPPERHAPITYPLALVTGRDGPEARALYRFLQGPEARAIFRARGFRVPNPGPNSGNRARDAP